MGGLCLFSPTTTADYGKLSNKKITICDSKGCCVAVINEISIEMEEEWVQVCLTSSTRGS